MTPEHVSARGSTEGAVWPAAKELPSLVAVLDLLLTIAAAALWYTKPGLGPWPLLLVAAGIIARYFSQRTSPIFRTSSFDLPLLLFLASAAMGVALAYDREAAWAKFWVIVAGLAMYGAFVRTPERVRAGRWEIAPVRVVLAVLPAVLAAYFLLTNDWAHWAGKLFWVDTATRWVASWQPSLPGHRLHPNVAGGLIAALIPLQVAAVGRRPAAIPLVALSAVALIMTASRGAWLALAVAVAGWIVWRASERTGWTPARRAFRLGLLTAIALAGALLIAWSLRGSELIRPAAQRLALLQGSLDLALDTPFTGIGLAGYQMAYSSYVLLLHVGHTIHSHNLPVNLWLEQGILGPLSLAWLVVTAVWTARRPSFWREAALASLTVILIHGMVDDAFYGSRGVILFFIPFALLARGELLRQPDAGRTVPDAPAGRIPAGRGTLFVALFAAAILVLALLPGTRAAFQADLAALAQTRAELSVYRWPEWPIQDALRRPLPGAAQPAAQRVDLGPAIARYQATLALDPANVTANRRLGQIELSRGQYEAARRHLETAYGAAPGQRATRQLLGESYALAGDAASAAALWRTVDLTQGQLPAREWWYGAIGETANQQRIKQAIERLSAKP
jgi:hypothetical protein